MRLLISLFLGHHGRYIRCPSILDVLDSTFDIDFMKSIVLIPWHMVQHRSQICIDSYGENLIKKMYSCSRTKQSLLISL